MKTSKFFVLEGLDGTGKTTIMGRLRKEFPDFVYTREPGGSEFGERIRSVLLDARSKSVPPLPFLLGFMTARASHFKELVLPSLEKGQVVTSDRFDASTFAFQLYGQENVDLEDLFWYLREEIIRTGEHRLYRPNYIYLRLDSRIAALRRAARQSFGNEETHFDLQSEDYHRRVFLGYEKFFGEIERLSLNSISPSENRVHFIDASLNPDEVYSCVKKIISDLLA
jgi:dTMP kinase